MFPASQPWAETLHEAAALELTEDTDAKALFSKLRTFVTQPEMPESGEFVRVMSLHKSKGLTNRVVIVSGCIHGLIPFVDRDGPLVQQDETLKEQRRLFYVAITRPKEILVLSSSRFIDRKLAYRIGAHTKANGQTITSAFLQELGPAAPTPTSGSEWIRRGFRD